MESPTIGDMIRYITEREMGFQLFGTTEEYSKKFLSLCSNLGSIVAEENKVAKNEARKLPRDTKLGEKAQKAFLELQLWVRNTQ